MNQEHEQQLRLECLKLAVQSRSGWADKQIVATARAYADFVLGTRDAEVIAAADNFARELARSSPTR